MIHSNRILDPDSTIERDQAKAILFQAKEYWVHSDVERFADLFNEDGEFVREGQHWHGHKAIRAALLDVLNQQAIKHIEIQRMLINGNMAVMEWEWETVDKESGDRLQKQEAIAIDFAYGRIQCWREHTAAEEEVG